MKRFKEFFSREKDTWDKHGDKVSAKAVANHIDKMEPGHWGSEEARKYKWEHQIISHEEAKKIVEHPRHKGFLDYEKEENADKRNITPESIKKHPPVIGKNGRVWDGYHRLHHAVKNGHKEISILRAVK